MNRLLLLLALCLFGLSVRAENPALADFNTNQFLISSVSQPKISILGFTTSTNGVTYVTNVFVFESNAFFTNIITTNLTVNNQFNGKTTITTNLFATNTFITYLTNITAYVTNLFAVTEYVTNLNVTYLTNQTFYTTNVFATTINATTNFVTENFSTNLFSTNIITTNLFATFITNNTFYTTNVFATTVNATTNFVTENFSTNLFSTNIITTNLFSTFITNQTIFTTNVFATTINTTTNISNFNITTNLNVVSNATFNSFTTLSNTYVTNITIFEAQWSTNQWNGPTNNIDFTHGTYQKYKTSTDMLINGLLGAVATNENTTVLLIDPGGADRTLYFPNSWTNFTSDRANAYTIGSTNVAIVTLSQYGQENTNVIVRIWGVVPTGDLWTYLGSGQVGLTTSTNEVFLGDLSRTASPQADLLEGYGTNNAQKIGIQLVKTLGAVSSAATAGLISTIDGTPNSAGGTTSSGLIGNNAAGGILSAGSTYFADGAIGVDGLSGNNHDDLTTVAIGTSGYANGREGLLIGTYGESDSKINGQTNVGILGNVLTEGNSGKFVGAYFETRLTPVADGTDDPNLETSVLLIDNRETDFTLQIWRTNNLNHVATMAKTGVLTAHGIVDDAFAANGVVTNDSAGLLHTTPTLPASMISGAGTVTSVQASGPAGFTWSGGPITSSGTLTATTPGLVLTNGETQITTFSNRLTVDAAHSLYVSNMTAVGVVTNDANGQLLTTPTLPSTLLPNDLAYVDKNNSWTSASSNFVNSTTAYATNSNNTTPDFAVTWESLLSTNNNFTWLAPVHVDTSGKAYQFIIIDVTNSSGSSKTMTLPANVHQCNAGAGLVVTNFSKTMWEYWPPSGPTNFYHVPGY